MKLSRRIVLELALFSLIYGLSLASIVSFIVRPRFEKIERDQALADLKRVDALVDQEMRALDANLLGYASWDDTVAYAKRPTQSYIDINYSQAWLASIGAEALCIADASGRVLYEIAYDPGSDRRIDLDGFFSKETSPGRALAATPGLKALSGFSILDGKIFLAVSRPIRNSADDSPSYGRIVFGRFYASRDEARVSELMMLKVSFDPGIESRSIGRRGASLVAAEPLPSLSGGAAGGILLEHPEKIIAEGRAMTELLAAATTLACLLFIHAIFLAVKLGALAPIAGLAASARALAASGHLGEKLPAERRDEIGDLAASFNGLLGKLEEANLGLEEKVEERTGELKRANEELRLMGEVFAHSIEGIVITDADMRILAVNPGFARITGFCSNEVIGKKASLFMRRSRESDSPEELELLLSQNKQWTGEVWNRRPDGTPYPVWISISSLKDDGDRVLRYIGVFHDISDAKRDEERMRQQAFYDSLTGLPNRVLLASKIENAIDRSMRFGMKAALLFLDLDRFKEVNDSFGHDAGDALLKEIGQRLRRIARGEDTVARIGGDEFVLLVEDIENFHVPAGIALRIIAGIEKPVEICGTSVGVGASVGIALCPEDGADAQTLLKNADAAMYAAKQAGKGTYRFHSRDFEASLPGRPEGAGEDQAEDEGPAAGPAGDIAARA
jgi:diguanylate cyclase (GGDEF)-like protein/PAS domain S-box-containing protein